MIGVGRLRARQEDLRSVLERHDTLATMPTGTDKSLYYQLPALHLEGNAGRFAADRADERSGG